jgi:hypothetical protein
MWLVVFLVCAAFPAFAGEVHEAPSKNCDAWIEGARKKIESKPVHRWRDEAIAVVARACDDVPALLRLAAAAHGKARSDEARSQALARGAATLLKANCLVSALDDFADSLVATCPLPIGEERRPSPKALGKYRRSSQEEVTAPR